MLHRWWAPAAALLVGFGLTNCGKTPSGEGSITPPPAVDAGNLPPPGNADGGAVPTPGGDAGGGDPADAGGSAGGGTSDAGGGTGGATDGGSASGGDAGSSLFPESLAAGESATALAIDADTIYWLRNERGGVQLRSMPKAGGTPSTLVSTTSLGALSLIAPAGGPMWEGSECAPPCDYPGAGHELAIFSLAPAGTYRRVAGLYGFGGLAATATTAFARSFDTVGGRYRLLACARDGSGCTTLNTDDPIPAPVYLDSGKLYYLESPTDTDFGPRSLLCAWQIEGTPAPAAIGCLSMSNVAGVTGLRVNGGAFALRAGGNVWTGSVDGTRGTALIWGASNGDEVDIAHGRVYWNQSQQLSGTQPGCLGSANLDGTDGHCLDQGAHRYGTVRVDETSVYFLRDGDLYRLPRQ